jgi:hypothetical protein
MLAEVALKMETRLRQFQGRGQVVRLDHVFSAFSSDVMCRICLSNHSDAEKREDFLDHPEFVPEWYVPTVPFRPSVVLRLMGGHAGSIASLPWLRRFHSSRAFHGLSTLSVASPCRSSCGCFPQAMSSTASGSFHSLASTRLYGSRMTMTVKASAPTTKVPCSCIWPTAICLRVSASRKD